MNLTLLKTQADLEHWQQQIKPHQINFVPTMGGLHKGHQTLIKAAKAFSQQEASKVLVSIFVNPLQFGGNEDFKTYPRDLDADCKTAYEAGAKAIWVPSIEDIFPRGVDSYFQIKAPSNLQDNLCGAFRKNHFDGVATVVLRLLNLVGPKRIFLGEKDWQQLIILRQLISELRIPVKVQSIPTVRDADGLPCSSRNTFLSKAERLRALALPEALKKAAYEFQEHHSIDIEEIKIYLQNNDLKVQYIETVDSKSLTPLNNDRSKLCLLAAAVHCGKTRLIDHTFLMKRPPIIAIDGPAGAGKSTVTKRFAKHLGLIYLDTGAMYRAVTWLTQKEDIDLKNEKALLMILSDLNLDIQFSDEDTPKVILNGQDITKEIRSPKVTSQVSIVAAQSSVREKLTQQQKQLGEKGGLVAEGRDIGTAVFPNADLKVFLTATPQERAKRRALDLEKQGFPVPNLLDLENQITERDRLDSTRQIAPLLKAKDAKELLTDGMSIEEVVDSLITLFKEEIPQEIWPTKLH